MRTQLQLLRARLLAVLMCVCLLAVGADAAAGKGFADDEREDRRATAAAAHKGDNGDKRAGPIARAADDDDDDDDRGRGRALGRGGGDDDDDDDDDDRVRTKRTAPAQAPVRPAAPPAPSPAQPRGNRNRSRPAQPRGNRNRSRPATPSRPANPPRSNRPSNRGAAPDRSGQGGNGGGSTNTVNRARSNGNSDSTSNRVRSNGSRSSGSRSGAANRRTASGNRRASGGSSRSRAASAGGSARDRQASRSSAPAARNGSSAPGGRSAPSEASGTSSVQEQRSDRSTSGERGRDAETDPPLPRQADNLPESLGPASEVVRVIPEPLRVVIGVLVLLTLFLAAGFAGATVRARRAERLRRLLADDVGLLQSALLPTVPPRVGPALVSAAYRPADGLAAGGDFYDAFALDENRTCVIVGDVAGHGREALPVTTSVRYTVRAYLESGIPPAQALRLAGEVLGGQLREMVTVVAAVYDASTGELTYACAGHPAPEVVGGDANGWRRPFAAPPLGAHVATGSHSTTIALPPGASACFYTDGLCDVRVGRGRLGFGGLREEAEALGTGMTASALLGRVTRLSSDQPDDMAAVVITAPEGAGRAAPARVDELELAPADLNGAHVARFLETCGIAGEEVREVLDAAARLADVHGSALLVVRRAGDGVEVDLRPPRATRFTRAH
jgi:hypothetical protein